MRLAVLFLGAGLASCGQRLNSSPAVDDESAAPTAAAENGLPASSQRPTRSAVLPQEVSALADRLQNDFPGSAEAFFAQGQIFEAFDQCEEAVWCWEQSLALDPQFALAHEQIGLVAMKRGEFAQAAERLRQASEVDSRLPVVHLELAEALSHLGRYEEAIPALERQTQLQPSLANGWYFLGQAHFQLGHYEQARDCQQTALKLDPDFLYSWFCLGRVYGRLGDAEQARQCRERFAELNLRLADREREQGRRSAPSAQRDEFSLSVSYAIAADLYAIYGRASDAQACWRRAAAVDRTNMSYRLALAQSLAQEGRNADALAAYEELHRLQPQNAELLLSMAMLHHELHQDGAAESALKDAVALAPDNPHAISALASLYLASGQQLPELRQLAQRLVRLQPTAENFFLLSSAYRANGDRDAAHSALQEARRLDPRNPVYIQAARALAKE